MRKALKTQTIFGTGNYEKDTVNPYKGDLSVLDNPLWNDIPLLKKFNLRNSACQQIGSSGSGNHFCNIGEFKWVGCLHPFIALMSHSGSRGVGYKIAKLYHDLAVSKFETKDFHGFAWLNMDTDEGKEYWAAMNLCAEFAEVSHKMIHARIYKELGYKDSDVDVYFTNHNIAFKETHMINGVSRDVIVHRKGAVRAFKDEYGIVAGSMGTPSYLIRGKGNEDSLCSCSHGSGRMMSRKAAKESFTKKQMDDFLEKRGIELLEGGLDECPMAYKDVSSVMDAQKDLVEIIGEFNPKLVMMSKEEEKEG